MLMYKKQFSLLFAALLVAGCASTDKNALVNEQQEQEARETSWEDEGYPDVDPYTGWVYKEKSSFSIGEGDIKLSVKRDPGSFCIYARPESGKDVPLLSTYDSFSSTFFSLKIGNKEYRLNKDSCASCRARKTPYGAQLAYTIKNKAVVVIDFSFMPSNAQSSRADTLRVTSYIINTGKKEESFSLKAVFDTVLGESSGQHFSTATLKRVENEMQFDFMEKEKWICSSDFETSVKFLLDGKGITKPQVVTLSNKDSLTNGPWIPSVKNERSFNSVLSYSNSALGINWPSVSLGKTDSSVVTFYISVGADSKEIDSLKFLEDLENGRTVLHECEGVRSGAADEEEVPGKSRKKNSLGTKWWVGMPNIASSESGAIFAEGKSAPSSQASKADASKSGAASSKAEQSKNKTASSKAESSKAKNDFDEEYARKLIKHIESLENDGSSIDQEELNRLNDELDAVLEKIRSKK